MAGSPTRIPVKLHKQVSLIRTTEPFPAEELLAIGRRAGATPYVVFLTLWTRSIRRK